ncbi:S46 family peptidase [Parabacteroides distasonis]|uniref:S46 family peptidase n=1 Tax=Parabacteroides distasonis TaxID=823 RepID=UPI003F746BE5
MKRFSLVIISLSFCFYLYADEGVWLPHASALYWENIKERGLSLPIEDLCGDDSISLKNAIIRFGGGCSGVIVSDKGLLMTNYHCALRYVEQVTTKECDYITEGYWAEGKTEIPIEGLSVRFLVRTEDVTDSLCVERGNRMPEKERKEKIKVLEKRYTDKISGYEGKIVPMFLGNRYYLYQYQVFRDIRLVGAPPLALGKFGKDVDNWMWPRHTADFALFRIYASPDNLPTSYSPTNVPYWPKKVAAISLRPLMEGDFSFVLGYPGSTDQYKHSEVLLNQVQVSYPVQIDLMGKYITLLSTYMERDALFKMRNTAQYGSVSNVMKRYQGFIVGMSRSQGIGKRKEEESLFEACLKKDPMLHNQYGSLLEEMRRVEQEKVAYAIPYSLYLNGWGMVALLQKALFVSELDKEHLNWKKINRFLRETQKRSDSLSLSMDKEWFVEVMRSYLKNVPKDFHFPSLTKNASSLDEWADSIYEQSALSDTLKVRSLLENNLDQLKKDPAVSLINEITSLYVEKVWCCLPLLSQQLDSLKKEYVAARMELFGTENCWPDANGTMRFSYGTLKGYQSENVTHSYYTTLDGMLQKAKSGNEVYAIPASFHELYEKKDFGDYAVNGTIPTCFIATNHTVGGNSGSPVFNASGELIGLNFDRNWEGTISDVVYDESVCRNITVDMHYILFIIDKYAKAHSIIKELVIRK